MNAFHRFSRMVAAASVLFAASQAFAAEDGAWSVSKSSGEVWITTAGVQQASLKADDNLKPGDTIRTGRNGRVLLVRGEETILIAPNSVIGLPVEKKDGLSTTIMQHAGSILLEVEKKNVKHFEVETPYLAAVVKGTQFRVSVNGASTNVEVMRGQVEVADFKTGQIAQVLPGQKATAFEHGKGGLSLSGSGTFNPIEQGKPRASSVERIPVPKTDLTSPRNAANGQSTHALATIDRGSASGKSTANASRSHVDGGPVKHAVTRISSALGEVKLNFHNITHGLARNSNTTSDEALPGTLSGIPPARDRRQPPTPAADKAIPAMLPRRAQALRPAAAPQACPPSRPR
jgi:FecR protein